MRTVYTFAVLLFLAEEREAKLKASDARAIDGPNERRPKLRLCYPYMYPDSTEGRSEASGAAASTVVYPK